MDRRSGRVVAGAALAALVAFGAFGALGALGAVGAVTSLTPFCFARRAFSIARSVAGTSSIVSSIMATVAVIMSSIVFNHKPQSAERDVALTLRVPEIIRRASDIVLPRPHALLGLAEVKPSTIDIALRIR
jgi:hypothetical protein